MLRREAVFGLGGLLASFGCARAEVTGGGLAADVLRKIGGAGLAGAVVGPEGIRRLEIAGVRRIGAEDPIRPTDLWHLGSNTKAMTAALYGRLVEQGEARWGATLPELFPDLTLDPAWANTTIEAVLSHTAGLVDDGLVGMGWLMKATSDARPLPVQRTEFVASALRAPPKGEPGGFQYGNANYIVAGAAIERITGGDWEGAIRTELFSPLGMASAGFGAPTGAAPWGHRGGVMGIGGGPVDPARPGADNPPALGPAGTAHMTLQDYARFLRLFLTEGDGLLKPETVRKLTTPLGADKGYALGWGVATTSWSRGPALLHAGSNTMWFVQTAVLPKAGVALVAASNHGGLGQAATAELRARMAAELPA